MQDLTTNSSFHEFIRVIYEFTGNLFSLLILFQNEFYDLNIARTELVVTEAVLIGGSRKAVRKIMCYTKFWLKVSKRFALKVFK